MSLRLLLTHRAEKDVRNMPGDQRERIKNALRALSERPLCGEALLGKYKGLRRYRVGDFRIVYRFTSKEDELVVLKIGHRREVCR